VSAPSRRCVLAAGALTALGRGAASAQESGRTYRLGVLSGGLTREAPSWVAFFDELGKAGFVEGRNLIVDWRFVGSSPEQSAASAMKLVQLAPHVLVPAGSTRAIVAAQAVTRTIPMVGVADDMVASGLIPSLARPGGNLTGISIMATELDGKRQEILMELVPASRQMAALADLIVKERAQLETLQSATAMRGVALSIYPVRGPEEIAAAIDAAQTAGATALNVLASPVLNANRKIILERSAALRLPAIYQWPETADEGGLAAYGPRLAKLNRQLARQVVKVLHGARPADIQVEQPTEFELVINPRTAKAIRLEVPGALLARADEVNRVNRRELLLLVGGAVTASRALRAQQKAMPVIGYLNGTTPAANAHLLAAFRQGLSETGYVEGQNVAIEYRWAEFRYDQLPALAADLVGRKVDVIAACGGAGEAYVAKSATSTIPIVVTTGANPVATGLVASLARPGGNLTGFTNLNTELWQKRVELIAELVPRAKVIGFLRNPNNASIEGAVASTQQAASAKGLHLEVLTAGTEAEIDAAFASAAQQEIGAMIVGDPLFDSRSKQVAAAARYAVPTIYIWRKYVSDGGLISYGAIPGAAYHTVGVYAGMILNGAKPADLPFQQSTNFELVVNLNTAKSLGVTVPPAILARADEVIE
jgi:putative ABC transport system substrate-binding protein